MKRISIIGVLAITALVAAAIPASAGSETSPKQYANGVCSALSDFGDAVNSTIEDLKDASSLEEAADTATEGVQEAADDLEQSLGSLDQPSGKDGKKAQQAIDDLGQSLSDTADSIQEALSDPPTTSQGIAALFAQIGSDLQKAVSDVKSTASELKGLAPNGELRKAFESSSACKQLKNSL